MTAEGGTPPGGAERGGQGTATRTQEARSGARRGRWVLRALQSLTGVILGLVLAELGFRWRDEGAFPHLNIYVSDAQLGVRLRPHATQAVRFGGAGVTQVRINSLGYRGGEWPASVSSVAPRPSASAVAPAPGVPPKLDGDVVVLGDSQVFGLGVEEDQTFAARLGAQLGVPVLNAGVPTWGPPEYNLALAELLERRHPRLVIWVVNVYNDFFEADRANVERHAVLDGWAVRRELAPTPTAFPGREWLFSRSHAVYALRRWLYGQRPDPNALGAPSEGTWNDLLGIAPSVAATRATTAEVEKEYLHVRDDEQRSAAQALVAAQSHVEKLAQSYLPSVVTSPGDGVTLSTIRSTPGDIVDYGDGGEFARPGPVTVDHIRLALRARNRAVELLRQRAAEEAGTPVGQEITDALAKEAGFARRVQAVRDAPVTLVRSLSPVSRRIAEAKAACDRAGAALLVVAIPMDVQVSAEEWQKYGAPPVDLEPTRVLIDDVVESAVATGARALDATDALRQAGAGAFLPRDLHLSVKGHAAVADAIGAALTRHQPRLPHGGLPAGRSRAPTLAEWKSVGETLVYGSTARACVTKRIREWLSLWCTEGDGYSSTPQAAHQLSIVKGGRGEALVARWTGPWTEWDYGGERVVEGKQRTQLVLVAPVLPGDELIVDFFWPGKRSRLVVRLPRELEAQTVAFEKLVAAESQPLASTAEAEALCACHRKLTGARDCLGLAAMPNADCRRTWGDDCAALVGCSAGQPEYAPKCRAGFANGGALDHCFPLCGPARKCAAGTQCVDWQGGELCMPEPLAEPSSRIVVLEVPDTSAPRTVELAAAAVKAGLATVRGCKLVNENQPNVFFDVYDNCPIDPAATSAAVTAARAFEAHVAQHPEAADARARLAARRGALFADWIEIAAARSFSRGTLPAFAELCAVWNDWQPSKRVNPYPEALLAQYASGVRTKGRAGPPTWVTCKTGPCL